MRWSVLGLVLLLVPACTPSHVFVRPWKDVIVSVNEPLKTRVRVPADGSGGLDVTASSTGVFRHEHGEKEFVSLSIELGIENRSESLVARFDPLAATLIGHDGQRLTPVISTAPPSASDGSAIVIEPGGERSFHLEFRNETTDDPREIVPFTLELTLEYGRKELPVSITFVGGTYPPYGYYGYYGRGYYAPYGYGGGRYYGDGWGYGPGWGPYWYY
jgi:hypothetical protein